MWALLNNFLACPQCSYFPLEIDGASYLDGEIYSGSIVCPKCHSVYPILEGIPSFVGAVDGSVQNGIGQVVPDTRPMSCSVRELQLAEMQFRDMHYQRSFAARHLEITLCLKQLNLSKADVCLDLGCGAGAMFLPLVQRCRELIGIDFSRNSLQYLRSRLPENSTHAHLVQADALSLPLRPSVVDCAVSLQMLEHIPGADDRKRVIQNVAFVLRPGGLLVLTVFHYSLLKMLRAPTLRDSSLNVYEKEGLHKGILYYYNFSLAELRELLRPEFVVRQTCGVETPLSHRGGRLGEWLERLVARTPLSLPMAHILIASCARI